MNDDDDDEMYINNFSKKYSYFYKFTKLNLLVFEKLFDCASTARCLK